MGRKPLGLFLAKDFGMAPITSGYFQVVRVFFGRLQRDPAYKISVFCDWTRSIDTSGEELRFFCVGTPKYNREVGMVDPTSLPIYLWLHRCEPWVAEDGFVLAEVGEEELKRDSGSPGSDV